MISNVLDDFRWFLMIDDCRCSMIDYTFKMVRHDARL
jgi:hypothetical protein